MCDMYSIVYMKLILELMAGANEIETYEQEFAIYTI